MNRCDESIIKLPLTNGSSSWSFSKNMKVLGKRGSGLGRNNVPVQQVLKRGMDICLSLVLLPLAIPLIIAMACWVKLDSKGPAFYVQTRIGKQGKPFGIIKIRTMHLDFPDGADAPLCGLHAQGWDWSPIKQHNDPRVTRAGKILRKHSLDELPQLFNVLLGQMSLVGPRPVVARELELYYKGQSRFYRRVRPGMTGLWQVSGRCTTSYARRVALDTCYVRTWSLWRDLFILVKTFKAVWTCEGAF